MPTKLGDTKRFVYALIWKPCIFPTTHSRDDRERARKRARLHVTCVMQSWRSRRVWAGELNSISGASRLGLLHGVNVVDHQHERPTKKPKFVQGPISRSQAQPFWTGVASQGCKGDTTRNCANLKKIKTRRERRPGGGGVVTRLHTSGGVPASSSAFAISSWPSPTAQ